MMLCAVAAAYGIVAALAFRFFTRPARLRETTNRILARIMELALFVDEPRTVLHAQLALLRENVRLLKQIAIPCLIMGALFTALYPRLEARYDNPNPDVLTLPLGSELPGGIAAETPPVRILRTHEVSWRIHPAPTEPHWLLWFLAISAAAAATFTALPLSHRGQK
ncbi:MAG: hypothetical protein KGN84_05630 [Acidobacteriota bacterium]|nr:hypothetical protein [Acidobacteriota bacterium]